MELEGKVNFFSSFEWFICPEREFAASLLLVIQRIFFFSFFSPWNCSIWWLKNVKGYWHFESHKIYLDKTILILWLLTMNCGLRNQMLSGNWTFKRLLSIAWSMSFLSFQSNHRWSSLHELLTCSTNISQAEKVHTLFFILNVVVQFKLYLKFSNSKKWKPISWFSDKPSDYEFLSIGQQTFPLSEITYILNLQ